MNKHVTHPEILRSLTSLSRIHSLRLVVCVFRAITVGFVKRMGDALFRRDNKRRYSWRR